MAKFVFSTRTRKEIIENITELHESLKPISKSENEKRLF